MNWFDLMRTDEKRELVNLVLSNPKIENGSLRYGLKKPFSMFAKVYDLENWRTEWDEFRTYLRASS